jgi:ferredoxin
MATHRRPDELQVFPAHRARAGNPSGGDGIVYGLSADEPPAEKSILRVALPGGNVFGASMEAGSQYLLLGFFVFVIGAMSAEALESFMHTPYGLVADVKMLNFFREMGLTAAIVLALLVFGSMLVQNFWCRYLCPYGALMGLVSLLSPVKIRRDAEACVDCGKCAHACPAGLPVDRLMQIRSAECSACMVCVAACPAQDALQFSLPPRRAAAPAQRWFRRALGPLAVTGILAYIFFGLILLARVTSHWQTNIPRAVYMDLVPHANELSHPGM